jgi:hypothetical protein
MTLHPPANQALEIEIEARLVVGEVLSPNHAAHVQECMSCARLFDDLAALAEQTPLAPADLNQRLLRAVIADQESRQATASRQRVAGLISLTALRAFLILLAVTVATFSAGVWAASVLGE